MQGGVRKRYGSWYYYFDLGTVDGKRKKIERKTNAITKQEAEKILRQKILEYENSGVFFEPSETTVNDYFQFWLKEYVEINLKHYSVVNYKGVIKNHVNPVLGNLKLRSLSPETLQKFINDKHRQGLKHKTLTLIRAVLQRALKHAVHPYRLLKDNPMQYVELPRIQAKKPSKDDLKIPSMETLREINNHLTEKDIIYIPYHIGINTGMRSGEVAALTWDCVDLDSGIIKVEKIVINSNGKWEFSTPKTSSSYRDIKIGNTLLKILKRQKLWQKECKLKYGEFYEESDFVCTRESGKPTNPTHIKYYINKLNEELNIKINFHSLRHAHATMLMEAKAPIKDIQARLGHSKASITIDTYSHLTEKMSNETVDLFENLMNN